MKLKKGIPVIDQGDKLGFWGGKFGGNFVPETLKKPIEDLEALFNKPSSLDHRKTLSSKSISFRLFLNSGSESSISLLAKYGYAAPRILKSGSTLNAIPSSVIKDLIINA